MIDERLWVRLTPAWNSVPDQRWLIMGSAHTHRGHFSVAAIGSRGYASVNLGDVVDCSPEARLWLDGFLAAGESTFWEFMGEDDERYDAATPDDELHWREWNDHFRARGWAPPLKRGRSAYDDADPQLTDERAGEPEEQDAS